MLRAVTAFSLESPVLELLSSAAALKSRKDFSKVVGTLLILVVIISTLLKHLTGLIDT